MQFNNKQQRRKFLKTIAATGTGLGFAVSGLAKTDPVFARLSVKMTHDHVDDVITMIKASHPHDSAELSFRQSLDNLQYLLDKEDPQAKRVVSMIENWLNDINTEDYGTDNDGLSDLPVALSDTMVGAYLACLDKFNAGEYEINELKRSLSYVDELEPDFIAVFAEKIAHEKNINPEFEEKFETIGYPALRKLMPSNSSDKAFSLVVFLAFQLFVAVVMTTVILVGEKKRKKNS